AVRTYWENELPKRHRDYPLVHPGEDSGPPPPEQETLRDLLARLPEEMIYKLALIVDVGRGVCNPSDLATAYQEVEESYDSPAEAASYMADDPSLAYWLSE